MTSKQDRWHYPIVYGETRQCDKIEGDLMGILYPLYTSAPLSVFHSVSIDDDTKDGIRHINIHISYDKIYNPGFDKFFGCEKSVKELEHTKNKLSEVEKIHDMLRNIIENKNQSDLIQNYECSVTHASTGFYWFDLRFDLVI